MDGWMEGMTVCLVVLLVAPCTSMTPFQWWN